MPVRVRRLDRSAVDRFGVQVLDRSADLDAWAAAVGRFLERRLLTFVFANNHYAGHSPATTAALTTRLARLAR